jgi:hypothetical protein
MEVSMKRNKLVFVLGMVLLGLSISEVASAHRGRIGVYIGPGPWYYGPPPYAYYPPYPYYPPVVTVPSAPPTYIQQGEAEPAPPLSYWYYCEQPQGYYPYVKQCPGGWQKVPSQPPAQ